MSGIDPQLIKRLREETGARINDCSKALKESNGNYDQAVDYLRKQNLAQGAKAATRAAEEGMLGHKLAADGKSLVLIELSANTDFVVKNQEFRQLMTDLLTLAESKKIGCPTELAKQQLNGKTVSEIVTGLAGKIGENIGIKRVVRVEGEFGYYVHHNDKEGAVVVLKGAGEKASALGKELSQHIVFAKPKYFTREQVPAEDIEREMNVIKERLKADPSNTKKPPEILEKIANGQIGKFYGEICLLDQPYYKENKQTVTQILQAAGPNVKIESFVHIQVGVA